MNIAVDRDLLYLALSNAPRGAVIDNFRVMRRSQDLEISWHMPDDPIAAGKIFVPSGSKAKSEVLVDGGLSMLIQMHDELIFEGLSTESAGEES